MKSHTALGVFLLRGFGLLLLRDEYLTVVLGGIFQRFEYSTHRLNLKVLTVDDFIAKKLHNTMRILFVFDICTLYLARLHESFAHIYGVLMMRNHLVDEQGDGTILIHVCSHTNGHGAIHRVQAIGELSHWRLDTWLVTNELLRTFRVWELEFTKAKGSTFLIIFTGHVICVFNDWKVVWAEEVPIAVHELDSSRHELVNL